VQEIEVKKVARELHAKLTELVAGFEWRHRQQTRAEVLSAIRFTLNELPEEPLSLPRTISGSSDDEVRRGSAARRVDRAAASADGPANL
jgi:hypothetical protein